jgi:hypothetical protein
MRSVRAAGEVETRLMTTETTVTLKIDSASLFAALNRQIGDFRLADHTFDTGSDELRVSYDSGGTGRVAVTVVFELDEAQMTELLREARSAP